MANKVEAVKLFHRIVHELKYQPMREYVANQFRTHQVTSKRVCRSEEELKHLGESYLCLLQNARQHEALIKQYSKGERSIEETAALVGLRVPERKLP